MRQVPRPDPEPPAPDVTLSPPDGEPPVREKADGPDFIVKVASFLPNVFMAYERLCRRIASPGVHNLGFFLSTAFLGPAGLYVWERRKACGQFRPAWRRVAAWVLFFGVMIFFLAAPYRFAPGLAIGLLTSVVVALLWFRREVCGLAAWVLLFFGVLFFLFGAPFDFVPGLLIGLLTLVPGRLIRRILKYTRLARARPMPAIPRKLTFEVRGLDIASLIFISVIFFVMVANRDELARIDMVTDSDPTYHMAVARQIIDQKGLPEWDRWEYAPFGRPHLYPSVLHGLIALFSLKSGNVTFGFNTVQMLLYPLALLVGWYFARWMFGAAAGFLSLIFLSMGTFYLVTQTMAMPAGLVTALIPLILMSFLARRTVATIALLVVALYTHGPFGVPHFVILGLLVFSMRYREYFPFFRKVAAFAGVLYLPSIGMTIKYWDWIHTSSSAMGPANDAVELVARGLLQLQIISPILLFFAFRTWWRDGDERLGAVKSLLLGFLPMLLAYGGRYFAHTWPLWAVLIARNFEGWLGRHEHAAEEGDARARKSMRRRKLAFVALAFLPLPAISFGMGGAKGPHLFPGFTGMNMTIFVALHHTEPDRAFEDMADMIRAAMRSPGIISGKPQAPISGEPPPTDRRRGSDKREKPDGKRSSYTKYLKSEGYAKLKEGILHIGTHTDPTKEWGGRKFGSWYFGDRLACATGCRVDTGGWAPEVWSDLMKEEVALARENDPKCLFAFQKKKKGAFTDREINDLVKRHRLEWTRSFSPWTRKAGPHYLVGGRGIAEPDTADADAVF